MVLIAFHCGRCSSALHGANPHHLRSDHLGFPACLLTSGALPGRPRKGPGGPTYGTLGHPASQPGHRRTPRPRIKTPLHGAAALPRQSPTERMIRAKSMKTIPMAAEITPTRLCQVCQNPLGSMNISGICVRPMCRKEHRRATYAGPERPCEVCGEKVRSKYGVCRRYPKCRKEHDRRRRESRSPYLKAGEKHNRWLALETADSAGDRVLFRCECGTEKELGAKTVRIGISQSCGCLRRSAKSYIKAGERYNRWLLLEDASTGHGLVLCRCDCGTERKVQAKSIKRGDSQSCGCLKVEKTAERNTKHGLSSHPLHGIYKAMLHRCMNPSNRGYASYGGRGITVCNRWLGPEGLAHFVEDMGERPSKRHTLDRINNDEGYCPENCRWMTWDVQARNKRPRVSNAEHEATLSEIARLQARIAQLEHQRADPIP
jgi:hypothetical protein